MREEVAMLHRDPRGHGAETEARFLALANRRIPTTPAWYFGTWKNSLALDIRGVDAHARIWNVDCSKKIYVPIEIKSSERGRVRYFENHTWAWEKGVIVFVVDLLDDQQVIEHLYARLERVRTEGRTYSGFFNWLVSKPMNAKGRARQERIRLERATLRTRLQAAE